jgi:FAD/FMN-containing dehydrogenase
MPDREPRSSARTLTGPRFGTPPGFRGRFVQGQEATELASRVSGPFQARPAAFASPRDEEDLAGLVEWAREAGVSLTPRGGGTGMPGGNLGPSVVVSLESGFSSVHPVEGSEGRIHSGAGAVAAEIDGLARRGGRFLPPVPSSAPWCTAGGMVATNAASARSFGYGAVARWVAAVEGIDSTGRPFRIERPPEPGSPMEPRRSDPATPSPAPPPSTGSGSRILDAARTLGRDLFAPGVLPPSGHWPPVRKNSSGYGVDRFLARDGDPLQLLVGSEGTLAFITGVEWETHPLPPGRGIALLPAASTRDIVQIAQGAEELGAVACELLGRRFIEIAGLEREPLLRDLARGAHSLLLLEVGGDEHEVGERLDLCRRLGRDVAGEGVSGDSVETADRLWGLRHAASPTIAREAGRGRISTQFIEDCVVPVSRLGEFIEGLSDALEEAEFDAVVFGHAGDGNLHVNPLVDVGSPDHLTRVRRCLERVTRLVAELHGTLAGEHGDGRLRAPYLERIWGPRAVEIFQRVKDHFDPSGILNPGVILPLEGQDPLDGFRPRARAHPSPAPDQD